MPREARDGPGTLKFGEMTTGAADGAICRQGPLRHPVAGARLSEIGPALLGKIGGEREHVVALERLGDRRHVLVLSCPAFVIAKLKVEIALLLTPDDGCRLLLRNAGLAMAGAADLRLLLDRLGARRDRGRGAKISPRPREKILISSHARATRAPASIHAWRPLSKSRCSRKTGPPRGPVS